jgi:hypothetical protein
VELSTDRESGRELEIGLSFCEEIVEIRLSHDDDGRPVLAIARRPVGASSPFLNPASTCGWCRGYAGVFPDVTSVIKVADPGCPFVICLDPDLVVGRLGDVPVEPSLMRDADTEGD